MESGVRGGGDGCGGGEEVGKRCLAWVFVGVHGCLWV